MSAAEPVIFLSAAEGLVKGIRKQLTPALQSELAAKGFDVEKLQAAYPVNTWIQALVICAQHLWGEQPESQRYISLGRAFIQGYVQTPMGFAALTMGRVIGLKRMLLRMGRNFKQAANYLETDVKDVGPKEIHIRTFVQTGFMSLTSPHRALIDYRHGVLEEILTVLGAKGRVEVLIADPAQQDVTFRVTWD